MERPMNPSLPHDPPPTGPRRHLPGLALDLVQLALVAGTVVALLHTGLSVVSGAVSGAAIAWAVLLRRARRAGLEGSERHDG